MLRRFRILERKIEHEEECNMEYYQYHFGPMNIGHEIMVSKYSFFFLKTFRIKMPQNLEF